MDGLMMACGLDSRSSIHRSRPTFSFGHANLFFMP
jgi:hypothetical protein